MSFLYDLGVLVLVGWALLFTVVGLAVAHERVGEWRERRWARRALTTALLPTPTPDLSPAAHPLVGDVVDALLGAVGLVTPLSRVDLHEYEREGSRVSVRVEVGHPGGVLWFSVRGYETFVIIESEGSRDEDSGYSLSSEEVSRPKRRSVAGLVRVVRDELGREPGPEVSNAALRSVDDLLDGLPEDAALALRSASLLGGLGGHREENRRALAIVSDLDSAVPIEWVLRRARA